MKKLLIAFALLLFNLANCQSIISVNPDNGNRAQQNLDVTITTQGIDFSVTTPSVNVSFIDQFSNILPANYAAFYLNNQLNVNLSIPEYAVPGLYTVNIAEVNGAFNMSLPNSFTVNNQFTYSIEGNVRYDSNSNGCDISDTLIPNQKLNFTNGAGSGTIIANNSGKYSYYNVQLGSNSFTPVLENPSYFTVTPPSASVTVAATNASFVQDFCIAPNGIHNDLEITLIPITAARPGFEATYKIIFKNKGTHNQNGTVTFNFNDSIMNLVTDSPIHNNQGTNTLSWNFNNLMPFEKREILVKMNINSPAESLPVNVGNHLIFSANVSGLTDETPINNAAQLNQTVVESFDPNDKICAEGNNLALSDLGNDLHYVIRFENTGTANAEFIVVKDMIDTSKLDITTLRPVSSSHSFYTRVRNTNIVEFVFQDINLPFDDANNDGYVSFKIKTKPTLTAGTVINNKADIYFDYNLPISTNTYSTTVSNLLDVTNFDLHNMFTLSPVPAKNNLTISSKQKVSVDSVSIYNTLGQLIQIVKNPDESIDVSKLERGTYIIKIISDKGTMSSQFIKE